MYRLGKVFSSESLLKIHAGGDVTIIAPWMVTTENIVVSETTTFEPGRLVIPVKEIEDKLQVFIPCGGPDPDTDNLPTWCRSYNISNELISILPEHLKYSRGVGVLTGIAKQDWTVIKRDQVDEGDFIHVRGQYLEVMSVGIDFNTDFRNSIRFTKNLLNNVKTEILYRKSAGGTGAILGC